MRKYYYSDGNEQKGPVTFDELKDIGLNRDTLIWHESLPNWVKVSELDELKDILIEENNNDDFNEDHYINHNPSSKKMKVILIPIGVVVLLLIISLLNIYPCDYSYREYYNYDYGSDISYNRITGSTFFNEYPKWKTKITVYNRETLDGTFKVKAEFYGNKNGTFYFSDSQKISSGSSYTFYFTKTLEHYENVDYEGYDVTPPRYYLTENGTINGNLFEFLFD